MMFGFSLYMPVKLWYGTLFTTKTHTHTKWESDGYKKDKLADALVFDGSNWSSVIHSNIIEAWKAPLSTKYPPKKKKKKHIDPQNPIISVCVRVNLVFLSMISLVNIFGVLGKKLYVFPYRMLCVWLNLDLIQRVF